jgi:GPH family glycoside/pentoside/hexuronide:cation symporter
MTSAPTDGLTEAEISALERKRPLGAGFKLLYGSGSLVDGVSNGALTYFLLFYLTAVCGLSGTLAGAALLVGLLVDAIADPAIGLLTDHTRSRTGRRHPYLLYSTIPVAILFGLLFSIPASITGVALVVYAAACGMALRIGLSLFSLPYLSVGAEVTDDYVARSSIVSWRICFTMLGAFLAIGLGLGIFMSGADGLLDRGAYVPFAWTCAAIMAAGGLLGAHATRRVLTRLHASTPAERASPRRLLGEVGEIFRNRSFVILFVAVVVFWVAQGVVGSLALYLNRYFWNLPTSAVQFILIAATLGPFLGAPLTALLNRVIDKKALTIANLVVFVLCQLWPVIARLAGALEVDAPTLTAILVGNAVVGGAALVGIAIGAQSMMADAADEHEFLFGVRREGLFFSGLTLAVKAATGLGGFLAGMALDLIHFPTAMAAKGGSLQLPADISRHLGIIGGPLPAVITLLAPVALLAYALSRGKHAAILAALDLRKRGPEYPAPPG